MISLTDAFILAGTKLKTRKVRMIIITFISALLFGIALLVALVFSGTISSVEKVGKDSLSSKYVLQIEPLGSAGLDQSEIDKLLTSKNSIKRAREIQKSLIADKKAEAKRLRIEYDEKTESPVITKVTINNTNEVESVDPTHPIAVKIYKESAKDSRYYGTEQELEAELKGRSPKYVTEFHTSMQVDSQLIQLGGTGLDLRPADLKKVDKAFGDGLSQYGVAAVDGRLIGNLLIEGQNFKIGEDGSLPIVLPKDIAAKILGRSQPSSDASTKERLEDIMATRKEIAGKVIEVCSRNLESKQLMDETIEIQKQISLNKSSRDFSPPSVIYKTPETFCGATTIDKDTRTSEEKAYDARQLEFDKKYGKVDPREKIIKLRIVGIASTFEDQSVNGVVSTISTLLSGVHSSGFVTTPEVANNPDLKSVFIDNSAEIYSVINEYRAYLVELSTAEDARYLIKNRSCSKYEDSQEVNFSESKSFDKCSKSGKYFSFISYGADSLTLSSIKDRFKQIFLIVLAVVVALGSFVAMTLVGRTIADSRRETAVFRAIGAKRSDILSIYITYVLMIAFMVSVVAVVIAVVGGLLVQSRYSDDMKSSVALAYNNYDTNQTFWLFELSPQYILLVVSSIFLAAIIGSILPLIRNIRRDPIRDMRNDT